MKLGDREGKDKIHDDPDLEILPHKHNGNSYLKVYNKQYKCKIHGIQIIGYRISSWKIYCDDCFNEMIKKNCCELEEITNEMP